MRTCEFCGEVGDRPPTCPGCGATENHPKSLDHDAAEAWWCKDCLKARIKEAGR